MKHRLHFPRPSLFAASLVALWSGLAAAEPPEKGLLSIMRALNTDTIRLTNALLIENWDMAEDAAKSIANHPTAPLNERMKILSHLGTRAGQFRSHDETVHQAALSVVDAVARRDTAEAGKHYGILVEGCLSCHESFRQEIRSLRLETGKGASVTEN